MTGDHHKPLDAYRAWSRIRPQDAVAMSNTGWQYQVLGGDAGEDDVEAALAFVARLNQEYPRTPAFSATRCRAHAAVAIARNDWAAALAAVDPARAVELAISTSSDFSMNAVGMAAGGGATGFREDDGSWPRARPAYTTAWAKSFVVYALALCGDSS